MGGLAKLRVVWEIVRPHGSIAQEASLTREEAAARYTSQTLLQRLFENVLTTIYTAFRSATGSAGCRGKRQKRRTEGGMHDSPT